MMNHLSIHSDSTPSPKPSKIAGFDVVRAAAAFGVVLLHCCVPYMRPEVPGLAWPIHDTPSRLAAGCFWTIELFIMPLFLVLAGFLAWQTLSRSGSSRLIKTRAKRLLLPLLFGIVVILPLDLYAWLLGWVSEGLITPNKLRSLKFDGGIDRDLWGLSHLWFLQYLFMYVVVMAIAAVLWSRLPDRFQRPPTAALALFALIGSATLTLFFRPEVVWGFQHSFWPVPSKWIYSGAFFALGVVLAAFDGELVWLRSHMRRLVSPAALTTAIALLMGRWHLDGGENTLASATLAVATCAAATLTTVVIIGYAAERVKSIPLSLQYLAAASFWVYIVHHPLLGLVQTDLKILMPSASPVAKLLICFGITTTLSLATYEMFARRTRLGRWLGFQWQPPQPIKNVEVEPVVISIDSQRQPAAPATRRAA